jgi:hypothetical protein
VRRFRVHYIVNIVIFATHMNESVVSNNFRLDLTNKQFSLVKGFDLLLFLAGRGKDIVRANFFAFHF